MTTFHDPKDAQKYRARLRKQREYQQRYRERLLMDRAPERSDIAAACLNAFLAVLIKDPKLMGPLPRVMIDLLANRGFDRALTIASLNRMAERRVRHMQRFKGE